MAPNKDWQSLLGLAYRAGKVVSGEALVLKAIRNGQAYIVLVSEDASANAMKQWQNKCQYYSVPLRVVSDRYQLGSTIGKDGRVAVAVNEQGFSKKLLTLLD